MEERQRPTVGFYIHEPVQTHSSKKTTYLFLGVTITVILLGICFYSALVFMHFNPLTQFLHIIRYN